MIGRNRTFSALAFGFVALGMTLTALGVSWPSVANDLKRSLASLGLVTLLFGGGYMTSNLATGAVASRIGIAHLVLRAAVGLALGLAGLAASQAWPVFLAAVLVFGLSGGFIDAATNTYVAIHRGPRAMGFLHGSFGIGAVVGPILVTGLLETGASWRTAFAILAGVQAVYITGLWLFARGIDVRDEIQLGDPTHSQPVRSAALMWALTVFFLYSGISVGVGVWAFTILTESRGISSAAGGLTVACYWAAFTASRLLLGMIGHRVLPGTILRWSLGAAIAGLAVFWWNPTNNVGAAGLIFSGFAHGPVFPVEMLLTRTRFGSRLTPSVVGFQIAASNAGGATIPGLLGLFVGFAGLEIIPPLLVINAVFVWIAIHMLGRGEGGSKAAPQPMRFDA